MNDRRDVREACRAVSALAYLQFEISNPHIQALYDDVGLVAGRGYFVVRAAPLGRAAPAVVAESFAYFPPPLVGKVVTRAWEATTPEAVVEATIRRLTDLATERWGERPEVTALVDVIAEPILSVDLSGRTLAAAWRGIDWPAEPPASRLFWLATLVREYRGDGHVLAHQADGRTALQGYLLAKAADGGNPRAIAESRSWRDPELAEALNGLERTGLLSGGAITAAGRAAWEAAESTTDGLTRIFDPIRADLARVVDLAEALHGG